jgi:hypothetical protein
MLIVMSELQYLKYMGKSLYTCLNLSVIIIVDWCFWLFALNQKINRSGLGGKIIFSKGLFFKGYLSYFLFFLHDKNTWILLQAKKTKKTFAYDLE